MKCVKCSKEIPDYSIFCLYCGKKQVVVKRNKARNRKGRGSVSFRKDKKKYWARYTTPAGSQIHIGYFSDEKEAWKAIDLASISEIGNNFNWTVSDVFNAWSKSHYSSLTKSGIQSYNNAWRYLDCIKNKKMRDIKTSHFQYCVDLAAEKYSRAICEKIKSLAHQLCAYAMQEDLINKNYAEFIQLPAVVEPDTAPFTEQEIKLLLENDNDDVCKIILILIYTGFRPTEFFNLEIKNIDIDNMFIRGGSKTEAGKNRIVPISSKIENYVSYFYEIAIKNNQKYLIVNSRGNRFDVNNFRNRYFYKTLQKIGVLKDDSDRHVTPYSTRHTFATLCDKADIDDNLVIKMIGHTSKKTTQIYIHKTESDMKEAIEAI